MRTLLTATSLMIAAMLPDLGHAQTDPNADRFLVGGHASTLGFGLTAGYDFSSRGAVRGLYNRFDLDIDRTVSGNDYDGDLDLESFALLLDWFPWSGRGFRVTGGLLLNKNGAMAATEAVDLDIGDRSYSGAMAVEADYGDQAAPYLGIGWRSGKGGGKTGFSFFVDAGILIQGGSRLSASGSLSTAGLGSCAITVSNGGAANIGGSECNRVIAGSNELTEQAANLIADLETEHQDLSDDLDDFKVWPVVLLGVGYSF